MRTVCYDTDMERESQARPYRKRKVPTMSAATTPKPTISDRYVAALHRATAAKLVAYRIDANTYEVPSKSSPDTLHTVTFIGPEWYRWTCSCAAGGHDCCMHRATALYARHHHIGAVRPTALKVEAAVAEAQAIVAAPQTVRVNTGAGVQTVAVASIPVGTFVSIYVPNDPLDFA
jgi:hypothetical protein